MELERRVEQLEQEVEILKHQIQETLLDIQEKMLNRTHPSLRSAHQPPEEDEEDEALSPNERPTQLSRPKREAPRECQPEQNRPQQPNSVKANKVVSITEYTGSASKNAAMPEFTGVDWEELDRMEAWVLHKLKSMGIAKTRKLIRLHMSKGRMSKEMGTALMQFVSLYDKKQQEPPTEQTQQEEPEEQNLILRLIAGVSNAGMGRSKGRKHG